MIVNVRQSKLRKIIDILLTFFGWVFLAVFLYNLITHFNGHLDFKFYVLSLANANTILLITFLVIFASAASLGWWSSYNRRKYGHLKRRTFPSQASEKELAEYFQVTEEELRKIQNDDYIERN